MKKLLSLFVLFITASVALAQTQTFHDFTVRDIEGNSVNLSDFHGKKVMVVNTASLCNFTPQFEVLQDLYDQYQQYDFEIIGFPCNDFDNQEPGSDSTILEFCEDTYGITFPMMSRIVAIEADTAPVYRWLQEAELNGVANAPVSWNFNKYLIDEAGHWVAHHSSFVSPTASNITGWIMSPSALSVQDGVEAEPELIQLVSSLNGDNIQLKVNELSGSVLDVQLFAADGKLIDVIHNSKATQGQAITYSTTNLSAGIYLIRATTEGMQQTLRYVVAG
jgi:glutathione peroxidase